MDLPFWGQNLQNAIDVVGAGANPPGGQAGFGLFQVNIAGVTLAAIATTSAPAIYNPPASGKLIRIMRVHFGDVSGTIIRSNLRYYWAGPPNVLTGITDVSNTIQARSRYVGSIAKLYSALTCTPAASAFMPVGFGSGGAIAAQFYWLQDQPEGTVTINPGELWYPAVSNAAMAMVADIGIIWVETPIVQGN